MFLSTTELPVSSGCVALGTIGTISKGTLKSSEFHEHIVHARANEKFPDVALILRARILLRFTNVFLTTFSNLSYKIQNKKQLSESTLYFSFNRLKGQCPQKLFQQGMTKGNTC